MFRFGIVVLCFSLCIIAGLFSTTLSLQTYVDINYGIATTVAILILLVANYLSSQFTIMKSFQSCRETNSDDTINRLESIESITLLASILLTVLVSIGIDMYSELQNTIIIFGLVFCVFILSTIFINGFCIRTIEKSLFTSALSKVQQRIHSQEWGKLSGLFVLPFVLYIPINLILLSVGLVELQLTDFAAYHNAAVRWLHNAPIYQTTQGVPGLAEQISEDLPYLYPPIFVLIFVPFTLLPPVVSGIIWNLVTLMFLIWSVSKLISTFDVDIQRSERFFLYLLVASFAPTITWMKLGQVSGLLVGLLCLSGATLRSDNHKLSGVVTTLGSIIKPFYATSGAHLLRNRSRLLSAAASGLAIIAIGILVFGLDSNLEYIEVLRRGNGWETTTDPSNWHATHFNPFYMLGSLKYIPRLIIILGVAGLALYSNKTELPIEYIFALGVAIVPLAAPTTDTLALSASIPAILTVGFYELENNRRFPKTLAISALFIHAHPYTIEFLSKFGPQIYPPLEILTPAIPFLQPALYGMGLLVGYLLYRSLKNPVV